MSWLRRYDESNLSFFWKRYFEHSISAAGASSCSDVFPRLNQDKSAGCRAEDREAELGT